MYITPNFFFSLKNSLLHARGQQGNSLALQKSRNFHCKCFEHAELSKNYKNSEYVYLSHLDML